MSSTPESPPVRKAWPDYRAVWRWHFYASLFCMPFVVVLAITGGIYLFKPQIEDWNERQYDHLEVSGTPGTAEAQIRAALAAFPEATLNAYELPQNERCAARVIVRQGSENIRVYVHPQTLEVLGSFPENERFIRLIFRLHGELGLGDRGSRVVELAASWTIIMLLTGLYLWWPRNTRGLGGILYPRLREGSRIFWRDIHSVTGVWISVFAMFLLLSGLPWAKSWGDYLKLVRSFTGTAAAKQDWANSSAAKAKGEAGGGGGGGGEHSGHGGGSGRSRPATPTPDDLSPVDRIAAAVAPLNLEPPVLIAAPAAGAKGWSAKSMTANRPYRVNLVVDGKTGEIISREDFSDRHIIDKIIAVGIAAHEGALFGWPNQLIGLMTALGLILLCVSGVVLWWRRRDQGVLGAPKVVAEPRVSFLLLAIVLALGIYLPFFGSTLVAVLLLEWLVLRRIPRVRDWLGLQGAGRSG